MSRPGPPPSPPLASLPQHARGIPLRPVSSLDRLEVTVRYNTWDVYCMEMAERWRQSHSADAPVLPVAYRFGPLIAALFYFVYAVSFSTAWRPVVPGLALWLVILWGVWWMIAPILAASRHAEAALSEPPVRFIFSPDGLEMTRLDVSMQIAWPGIRRVRETRTSFLLYPRQASPYATAPDGRLIQVLPSMKLYFTIPLHCFADAADLRLVRALLRKHVAADVKLRA